MTQYHIIRNHAWGRRRTDIEIVVINLHLLLVIEDPSEKKK